MLIVNQKKEVHFINHDYHQYRYLEAKSVYYFITFLSFGKIILFKNIAPYLSRTSVFILARDSVSLKREKKSLLKKYTLYDTLLQTKWFSVKICTLA